MPRLGGGKVLAKLARNRMNRAVIADIQSRKVVEVAEREEKREVGPVTLDDLWIQDKDGREWCLGSVLNEPQKQWLAEIFGVEWRRENPGLDLRRGKLRSITLKARQEGITTLVMAVFVCNAANRTNFNALFFADTKDKTEDAFKRVNFFYQRLPIEKRPIRKGGTTKVLDFVMLNSRVRIATAGSRDVGRSGTIHAVHWSETAFAPDAARMGPGLFNSVPMGGSIIMESTAEGDGTRDAASGEYLGPRGAFFAHEWREAIGGRNGFHPVFLPWHTMAEYRLPCPLAMRWAREGDGDSADVEIRQAYARYGDEVALKMRFGLHDEQLYFRRSKIDEPGMGLSKFQQEYPSTWEEALAAGGSFMFPEFDEDIHTTLEVEIEPHCPGFGSFDWGFDKPAAFGLHRSLDDGTVIQTHEIYAAGKPDPVLAKEIRETIEAQGLKVEDVLIFADPSMWAERRSEKRDGQITGPRRVDAYYAEGLNFVKADNSRVDGWANLREYLRLRLVRIHKRCSNTIRTLKNLPKHPHRPDDSDNRNEAGVEDHAPDMLRYGLMSRPVMGRALTEDEKQAIEAARLAKESDAWRAAMGLKADFDEEGDEWAVEI